LQPTYPELDIQPTGKCEVWIREINQITHVKLARTEAHRIDTEIPTSPTNCATLPQVSDATRACIYIPDGKFVGMLSTKLYINLANAFHHARDSGYHNKVVPPPKDLKAAVTHKNSHCFFHFFSLGSEKNLRSHTIFFTPERKQFHF